MVILALSGVSGIHPRKLGSLPIHKAPPHYCQKAIHRSVEYELLCLLRLHWEKSKLLTHSYAEALKQRKNKKFCIKLESRSSVVSQSLMVVCFRVVEVFKPGFSKMKGMLFLLIVITICMVSYDQRWTCLKIFTRRVYAQAYAFQARKSLGVFMLRLFYAQAFSGISFLCFVP